MIMDRFKDTFNKFSSVGNYEEISNKVNLLICNNNASFPHIDTLKKIHGCIDVTTLRITDTKESVLQLVHNTVNDYEGTVPNVPNVASVCVYPLFVDTVKNGLTASGVKVAAVAGGFPDAQTFPEIKIAEVSMALMQGADEIDTVMNIGYFIEEDYETLTDELSEIKECCRESTLKVIIETGAIAEPDKIRRAAILALYSGADFIKTSTGKNSKGATPEAVYIMCKVLKEYAAITGRKAGIKVAGGINTVEDALKYYKIVNGVLGDSYCNKNYFRIGSSKLVDVIEKEIAII
jgi:deoxyribose-phosphate aldolase